MKPEKPRKILYRVAKGFIIFFMILSAYFTSAQPESLAKLGFPDYFRIELTIAKVVGAVMLVLPFTSVRIKEWIYSGFVIAMTSGLIAHICSGDPISKIIFVCVDLALVLLSIYYVSKTDLSENKMV